MPYSREYLRDLTNEAVRSEKYSMDFEEFQEYVRDHVLTQAKKRFVTVILEKGDNLDIHERLNWLKSEFPGVAIWREPSTQDIRMSWMNLHSDSIKSAADLVALEKEYNEKYRDLNLSAFQIHARSAIVEAAKTGKSSVCLNDYVSLLSKDERTKIVSDMFPDVKISDAYGSLVVTWGDKSQSA